MSLSPFAHLSENECAMTGINGRVFSKDLGGLVQYDCFLLHVNRASARIPPFLD